ncbi:hypothetical protein G9A89_013374 [Geosiphon pyriformis]|nr:hypothetical protein G9A89_013374 [Geosiphon pyriformis]
MPIWTNSCGVAKGFDYILISSSLFNAIIDGSVASVDDYFDTDHKAVSTFVDLGVKSKIDGRVENQGRLTLFLAAGAFVDNTIWVGNSQIATQYILDIASKFFIVNDILINNKKTKESYQYLDIYLSSENLSKLSLVKMYVDIRFFINLVLKKAISDKQFLYLVLAVLQPIGLRLNAGLSRDFPNKTFHYLSLYGLKFFEQLQTECKMASVLCFSNAGGILGYMRVISVYTDRLLRDLGSCEMKCGAAAYFFDLDLSISARVGGLVSSTMVELQAIALALECVSPDSLVVVFLDSQAVLNACVAELALVSLDFYNRCWIEWHDILNLIKGKQLDVFWRKVKEHSGVIGNECVNKLASLAAGSPLELPVLVKERFIKTGRVAMSRNVCHFAHKIFRSVNCAYWEVGFGFNVIDNSLYGDVDWFHTALV